jgi:hypothetical protein
MGEIKYYDHLDETREHITQFSGKLVDVNIDDAETNLGVVNVITLGAHNCADYDCPE